MSGITLVGQRTVFDWELDIGSLRGGGVSG